MSRPTSFMRFGFLCSCWSVWQTTVTNHRAAFRFAVALPRAAKHYSHEYMFSCRLSPLFFCFLGLGMNSTESCSKKNLHTTRSIQQYWMWPIILSGSCRVPWSSVFLWWLTTTWRFCQDSFKITSTSSSTSNNVFPLSFFWSAGTRLVLKVNWGTQTSEPCPLVAGPLGGGFCVASWSLIPWKSAIRLLPTNWPPKSRQQGAGSLAK